MIPGGIALGDGDTEAAGCGAQCRSSGAVVKDGGVSLESLLVPAVTEVSELDGLWILGTRGGTIPGASMLGEVKAEPVELVLDTVWTRTGAPFGAPVGPSSGCLTGSCCGSNRTSIDWAGTGGLASVGLVVVVLVMVPLY